MIKFSKFEDLWKIVREFGVKNSSVFEIVDLEADGLEIADLSGIVKGINGLYKILADGTVVKVLIYIPDRDAKLIAQPEYGFPKFHLFNCETIQDMARSGRSHRYKISCRADGKFLFTIIERKKRRVIPDQELEVCMYCLKTLNANSGMNIVRGYFVKSGNLKAFLQGNLSQGLDTGSFEYDYEAIPNAYANDWDIISKQIKSEKQYKCQSCGWQPRSDPDKRFIHGHHKDGRRYNSKYDNILVLCIKCHSEEPGHSHLKNSTDYATFLKLRQFSC